MSNTRYDNNGFERRPASRRRSASLPAMPTRMFDLDANPQAIHQTLIRDPLLALRIAQLPGLRLPGSGTLSNRMLSQHPIWVS